MGSDSWRVSTEFLEVGKKQPALDVLYDVIKSKKHRTWQKIHEPIMLKYLELCVDLRKSHLAKEGLYQYKNICQQVRAPANHWPGREQPVAVLPDTSGLCVTVVGAFKM